MKKQYKSTKRPRDSEFDSTRFIPSAAFKVLTEILSQENITDYYYFNFRSLERANVQIREFFSTLGIGWFIECREPIYPNLVREFYANLHVRESEGSTSLVIESVIDGTIVKISSEILNELFGLSIDGFVCFGKSINDEESYLNELEVKEFLSLKVVIEITDDVFENNDFGIQIRLLLVALTKCLMLKVNTQYKLVGIDKLVVYRVLNDDKLNFAAIVTSWMKAKGDIFHSKHYASRSRKAGMPFGSILTILFQHHNMNLSKEASVSVSRGHEISKSMLKAMYYVETINRGWVLFSYLKEDDEVPKGTRVPTPAERVTRRGPGMLREMQMGTFV